MGFGHFLCIDSCQIGHAFLQFGFGHLLGIGPELFQLLNDAFITRFYCFAEGIELILRESIRINGKDGKEDKASIDTTVQEKNITYPTDSKLHGKIIKKCVSIAEKEGVELRQRYSRTLKKLGIDQRFRNYPKNGAKARKADKKVKTIAGRLVRELQKKTTGRKLQQ
jgi:hypothetical protein